MNQLETVKLAAKSWIRKPKGFRIRCSQFVDGARVEQLMPERLSRCSIPMYWAGAWPSN